MIVGGVDGCRAGWVAFYVEIGTRATCVEVIDLTSILKNRPPDLVSLAIDIPIGLLDGSRECDKAARKLLGQPRGTSVFAAPCRAALAAKDYAEMNHVNRQETTRGLSRQAAAIVPKIKEVEDAITPETQVWAFEVHPEVCFWALAGEHPINDNKKTGKGQQVRSNILRAEFPDIDRHLAARPKGVGKDDLLDASAAAWTALRHWEGKAICLPPKPQTDKKRLEVCIRY